MYKEIRNVTDVTDVTDVLLGTKKCEHKDASDYFLTISKQNNVCKAFCKWYDRGMLSYLQNVLWVIMLYKLFRYILIVYELYTS